MYLSGWERISKKDIMEYLWNKLHEDNKIISI